MFKVKDKVTRTTSLTSSFWRPYFLTLNIFHTFFSVSLVDLVQVVFVRLLGDMKFFVSNDFISDRTAIKAQ